MKTISGMGLFQSKRTLQWEKYLLATHDSRRDLCRFKMGIMNE